LRDRCQSHFLTLRIPVEPAALDELLARAEKESLSHLRFLDLLLGTQADARREPAVAAAYPGRTFCGKQNSGRLQLGVQSEGL